MYRVILSAALLCIFAETQCRAAEIPSVYASQPWLAGMARFIVGTTMRIVSASVWNSSGTLRVPRRVPQGASLIALDPADAGRFGFAAGQPGLHLLYDNLPIEESKRGALQFNPSVLPFLSQRMLIVLCELSPDNYSFYQRRLAEFQSRLESTAEVGRSLIFDVPILDLAGSVSPWLMAAGAKTVRPPDLLWNAWTGNTRTPDLALAVKEAESRGWWILMDAWTPPQIRSRVTSGRNIIINAPDSDRDFFEYLHDIYLQIWSAAVAN
ncbi:MAG: hypothetical protein LBR87_05700 [Synergistaceae bacterium]|jgi:hypothetical protein|nr:hypothetical protein [Synergistaceae bacterium]